LDPSDYGHSASSAKNSDEKQVAVIPRKAKTKTRKQGKSNQAALKAGVARSIWETLSHTTGRTESNGEDYAQDPQRPDSAFSR
jgi:hypothetical protein